MWRPHLRPLSITILKRHERFGAERHAFIIFYALLMEAYATLSSCSNGESVDTIVEHQLLTIALPPYSSNPRITSTQKRKNALHRCKDLTKASSYWRVDWVSWRGSFVRRLDQWRV